MKAQNKNDINGILILDKPKDFTSNDCLAVIKKSLSPKKIGHTGTLDTNATGVLVCLLGDATKCQDYLMKKGHKVYEAELILGVETDTEDITGTTNDGYKIDEDSMIITKDVDFVVVDKKRIERKEIEEVCKSFIGDYKQVPPMYSAKKINGKKLINLARKGKEIERKACDVHIYDIEIGKMRGFTCIAKGKDDKMLSLSMIDIKIECSKGTYIRTLCKDIGRKIGYSACMGNLRRVSTGDFKIENAVTLEEIKEKAKKNDYTFIKPCFYKEFEQVITFGKYETLHLGHQKVINKVVEMAHERDIESTVLIVGANEDTELLTRAQRISKLKYFGVDNIMNLMLTESVKDMSPEDFIKEILFKQLKARVVVVGTDASFGKGGKGNIALLRKLGKENGVTIEVVEKIKAPEREIDISSTYIKKLYNENKIDEAKELM